MNVAGPVVSVVGPAVSAVSAVVSAVNALVNPRPSTRLDGRPIDRLTRVREAGQQPQIDQREHVGEQVGVNPVHRVSTRLDQRTCPSPRGRSIESGSRVDGRVFHPVHRPDQQQGHQEREAVGLGLVAGSAGQHEVSGRPRAEQADRHHVIEGGVLQVGERGAAVGAMGPVASGELRLPCSPPARVQLVRPHAVTPGAGSTKSMTVRSTEDRAPRCSAISVGLALPRSSASTRRSASWAEARSRGRMVTGSGPGS